MPLGDYHPQLNTSCKPIFPPPVVVCDPPLGGWTGIVTGIQVPPDPCAKPFDHSLRDRLTAWVAAKRAMDTRDLSAAGMLGEIEGLLGEG
jgi:hypothetical protein